MAHEGKAYEGKFGSWMRNIGRQDNFHRPSHHIVSTFLCTPPPRGGISDLSHLRRG